MKNLYLVRHGETLFNRRCLIQGVCNSPLLLEGVAQALHTRKVYLEGKNIQYDHVYSSPEGRCIQTTELLTSMPYETRVDLHEMCFGKLECAPDYLAGPASEFSTYYGKIGGETTEQVQKRMNKVLFEIMNDPDCHNALVIAHGCANEAFLDYWKPNSEDRSVKTLNNCSVLHFLFDDEKQAFDLIEDFNEDFQTEDLEAARAMNQALIVD